MDNSKRIDHVLLEEPPTVRFPDMPPRPPGQGPDFRRVLDRAIDRVRMWASSFTYLIKSQPRFAWVAGISLVVVVAFAAWLLHRSGTTAPANPRAAEIEKFQNLARDAYKSTHYAFPVETSAIAYSKRVLELDPSNKYARTLLENSVQGGKYQVQQALKRKDFGRARRVANSMAQLLPGRKDIAELNQEIRVAEQGATVTRPPKATSTQKQKTAASQKAVSSKKAASSKKAVAPHKAAPAVSFSAYHLHSGKSPADHGPYCLGTISLNGHHLKFVGRSSSKGQKVHKFDIACSNVREIKKNSRTASRQGGFHVRTASATMNFVPKDSSPKHISALASACSK